MSPAGHCFVHHLKIIELGDALVHARSPMVWLHADAGSNAAIKNCFITYPVLLVRRLFIGPLHRIFIGIERHAQSRTALNIMFQLLRVCAGMRTGHNAQSLKPIVIVSHLLQPAVMVVMAVMPAVVAITLPITQRHGERDRPQTATTVHQTKCASATYTFLRTYLTGPSFLEVQVVREYIQR